MIITDIPSLFQSYLAGLIGFFAPCTFPLFFLMIPYVFGISLPYLFFKKGQKDLFLKIKKTLSNTLFFVFGMSGTFYFLGASATKLGWFILSYQKIFSIVTGLLGVLVSLFIARLISLEPKRTWVSEQLYRGSIGNIVSFLLGAACVFGSTPCAGPLLGNILLLTGDSITFRDGKSLLFFYTAGWATFFFVLAPGAFFVITKLYRERMRSLWERFIGFYLVIFFLLLLTGVYGRWTDRAFQFFHSWALFLIKLGIY